MHESDDAQALTVSSALVVSDPILALKDPTIFTFTVVSGDPFKLNDKGHPEMRTRTWGYYVDRIDAEHAIENNETDMSELGYYRYAVLCEVGEGPLPTTVELQWYEFIWDRDTKPREHDGMKVPELVAVDKIEKPEKYGHFMFGGLG